MSAEPPPRQVPRIPDRIQKSTLTRRSKTWDEVWNATKFGLTYFGEGYKFSGNLALDAPFAWEDWLLLVFDPAPSPSRREASGSVPPTHPRRSQRALPPKRQADGALTPPYFWLKCRNV